MHPRGPSQHKLSFTISYTPACARFPCVFVKSCIYIALISPTIDALLLCQDVALVPSHYSIPDQHSSLSRGFLMTISTEIKDAFSH
ncbi:hypothetical protein A2U01_0050729, partial [Trifolium medium]|nr:hypothetical protein [Trifolium medium]